MSLAGLVEVFVAEVGRLDVALGAAAVETLALELVGQHAAVLSLLHQGIGDLDLAALARFSLLDQVEDVRGQDVAADDRQVRRRLFRLRLLDHGVHPEDIVADHLAGDHAVLVGLFRRHFLDRHDGAAELVVQLDHLLQHAVAFEVQAQIVGQDHGERLVADQRTTGEDGVAEALHLHLAGVGEGALVDQPTDADQVLFLVGVADLVFQLVADVEVVFQRTLAAAGDDADLGKAGFQRLLHRVLDQQLVHHRQHFLGHGLGGREETSAVTGGREKTFLDHENPSTWTKYADGAQSNQAALALQCPALGRPMPW